MTYCPCHGHCCGESSLVLRAPDNIVAALSTLLFLHVLHARYEWCRHFFIKNVPSLKSQQAKLVFWGAALVRNAGRAAQRHFHSPQLRQRGPTVYI
jgi:hypothetical protein